MSPSTHLTLDGNPIGDSPDVATQFLPFDLHDKLPTDVVGTKASPTASAT